MGSKCVWREQILCDGVSTSCLAFDDVWQTLLFNNTDEIAIIFLGHRFYGFLHAGLMNITSEIVFLEGNTIKSSLFFHVYFQKKLSFSVRFRWWRACDFHLKCAFCFCLVDMFSWFNTVYWLFQGLPTISNSTWMNLSPFLIYSLITIYFSYEWNTSWQLKGFNDQFYL